MERCGHVQWWGQGVKRGDKAGKYGIQDKQLSQTLYVYTPIGL